MNIILVSDSLAKSRSVALSQGQVLAIAFGILLAGFLLATATYMSPCARGDLRNPYLSRCPARTRTTSNAPMRR